MAKTLRKSLTRIKIFSLLLFTTGFVLNCTAPRSDIGPANSPAVSQTPVSSQPSKSNIVPLGPVVQITEYVLNPNGGKIVTLNDRPLTLNWRIRNSYTYDGQNRLTHQKTTLFNNSDWWEERAYQYTPDLVEHYQNNEHTDWQNLLLLTDKGYLRGNAAPGEYVYDADGYLIRYMGNNQQDTYTLKEGNVVAKETVYSSGSVQRNVYEYDLTKPGIPSPLTFRGRQSWNLLVKQTLVTTTTASSVSETTVFNYYYHVDAQGRPIWEFVVTNAESTPASIREFAYQ